MVNNYSANARISLAIQALSPRQKIKSQTNHQLTVRKNQDYDAALAAVRNDLSVLNYDDVDCIRCISMYAALLSPEMLLKISTNTYGNNYQTKPESTTHNINKFTHGELKLALGRLQKHASQAQVRGRYSVTSLLTQTLYHFASLSKPEKLAIYGEVISIFSGVTGNFPKKDADRILSHMP